MKDRRKSKRNHVVFYLRVFDRRNNNQLGNLIDISRKGLRIIRKEPMKPNLTYEMRMELPKAIEGRNQVEFDARSVWCVKGLNTDFYDTGFELKNMTSEKNLLIERSVEDFLFDH